MDKLGRNSACPCGSGKKYKKCCAAGFSIPKALSEALAFHESGDYFNAKALYLKILDQNPEEADALHLLGVLYYQSGDLIESVRLLEKACALRPSNADYLNHLGLSYRGLKRYDAALRCYQKALEYDTKNSLIFNNLGTLFVDLSSIDKAIFCYRKALQLDAESIDAWNNLANALLSLNQLDEALSCFEEILKRDAMHEVAKHMHCALTGKQTEQAPNAYIESTFDSYADRFDEHLIASLQYDAPKKLVELIQLHSNSTFEKVLDLGCGTGLVGVEIAPFAKKIVGVDLSLNMLSKALQRNIYRRLEHSDLASMMQAETIKYDLIVAADVFVYFGRLDSLIFEASRLLDAGGLLAFSVEMLDVHDLDYRLDVTGRYAHSEKYLRSLALAHGFEVKAFENHITRIENSKPVHSWLSVWCPS